MLRNLPKIRLEPMRKFIWIVGYKVSMQNQLHFYMLSINN